jgi:uncharacterized membrane protein
MGMDDSRTLRIARIVAGVKLAFGSLEVITGLTWLIVSPAVVQHRVQELLRQLAHDQPDNPGVKLLQHQLPALLAHGTLVALALIMLGLIKVAGALGFLSGRPWGYYLFVASLLLTLPFDLRSAARDGSPLAIGLGVFEAAVLAAVLYWRRALTAPGRLATDG